jgi:hypothetical protein
MRTWLVLVAVALVALAAAADGLRGHSSERPAREATRESRVTSATPFSAGLGTIYYSDPRECFLKGVTFPNLQSAPPPKLRSCRFALSPDGRTALRGDTVWQPQGGLFARERTGLVEVGSPASRQTHTFVGQTPAFKPDGTLTYVRGDEVVEWSTRCAPGATLVTLPGDNATARCLRVLLRARATSLVWLTDTRAVAILGDGELAIFAGGRSVLRTPLSPARRARVEASPTGSFFAVWLDGELAGAFDPDGASIVMPPVPGVRALACSPDEQWCAVATGRGSVFAFRPDTGDARLRLLGFRARDLAWR